MCVYMSKVVALATQISNMHGKDVYKAKFEFMLRLRQMLSPTFQETMSEMGF